MTGRPRNCGWNCRPTRRGCSPCASELSGAEPKKGCSIQGRRAPKAAFADRTRRAGLLQRPQGRPGPWKMTSFACRNGVTRPLEDLPWPLRESVRRDTGWCLTEGRLGRRIEGGAQYPSFDAPGGLDQNWYSFLRHSRALRGCPGTRRPYGRRTSARPTWCLE